MHNRRVPHDAPRRIARALACVSRHPSLARVARDARPVRHPAERALPALDLCLHEALRLYMNVPRVRRNAGGDAVVAGRTIASGDYVMYMMEDAHMDARAYRIPFGVQWLWPVLILCGLVFAPEWVLFY